MKSNLKMLMWMTPYLFWFTSPLGVFTWATLLFFFSKEWIICSNAFIHAVLSIWNIFPTTFFLGCLLSHIYSSYFHINVLCLRKSPRTPDVNEISTVINSLHPLVFLHNTSLYFSFFIFILIYYFPSPPVDCVLHQDRITYVYILLCLRGYLGIWHIVNSKYISKLNEWLTERTQERTS